MILASDCHGIDVSFKGKATGDGVVHVRLPAEGKEDLRRHMWEREDLWEDIPLGSPPGSAKTIINRRCSAPMLY